VVLALDAFVEAVIWEVSEPVPASPHGFKYRLAYVVGGRCVARLYTSSAQSVTENLPRGRKRSDRRRYRALALGDVRQGALRRASARPWLSGGCGLSRRCSGTDAGEEPAR